MPTRLFSNWYKPRPDSDKTPPAPAPAAPKHRYPLELLIRLQKLLENGIPQDAGETKKTADAQTC